METKTKYEVISMKMDHILLPEESWDFSNEAFWTAFDSEISPETVDDWPPCPSDFLTLLSLPIKIKISQLISNYIL